MPPKKKTKKVEQPVVQESKGDLMDCFHTENICEIFRLNTYKKPASFKEYRPKSKKDCLDYNISRTDTKLDAGPTKIHYQETQVKYELHPPENATEQVPPKPKRKKKSPIKERGKGVWVFEDEKRAARIELLQQKAKMELRERLLKKFRNKAYENNFLYLLLYSPEERARRCLLKKMDHNSSKRSSSKKKAKPKPVEKPEIDLMEQFHPDQNICQIIPTNAIKKKDAFSIFRPKHKDEYLDYNISQTDAKFDAGPTKIHYRQTRASYEPRLDEPVVESVPVPKKKRKQPKGRHGPVWVFEDEIRAAKCEIQQKIALQELKKRIARKTKNEKALRAYRHRKILKELGPSWFQELSPDQLKTVDELRTCIGLDLLEGTIIHTQENVGKLGLVLRPNHKHVEIALAYCCGSPVEFLLILYQISNPKRVFYSLNDKLLLSAMVHLTLRETLRELHIRIPSPPKKKQRGGMNKKEEREKSFATLKGKHKSAYLCSFTFEPTFGIHTEGYRDNHVQYPESPYFDYVNDLRKEIAENLSDQGEEDYQSEPLTRQRRIASRRYETEERDDSYDSSLERELNEELEVAQNKYNKLTKRKKTRRLLRPSIYRPCRECFTKHQPEGTDSKLITASAGGSEKVDVSLSVQVKITDQYDENDQHVSTKYQYQVDIKESPQKVAVETIQEPTPVAKQVNLVADDEKQLPDTDDNALAEPCHCLDELGANEEDSSTDKSEVIPVSSRDKGLKQNLVEVKAPPPWNCTCKEIVEQYVEEVVETRQECMDVCRKKRPTFIIADTKTQEGEKPIPIIEGVKAEKTCTCLEKFKKNLKLVEDRKIKKEAQDALKSTKQRYVVSGVRVGIDGKPIYMLTGIAEEIPCRTCVVLDAFRKQEEERLAHMPVLPAGRQKYAISGVQQRPEGNVYIISGAVPAEDCECMRLYEAYVRRHGRCMDLYNQYVQKVKAEVAEYMAEVEEETEPCKCLFDASLTPSDEDEDDEDDYCPCAEKDYEGEEEGDDTNIVITVEVGDTAKKPDTPKTSKRKPSLEFDKTEIKRFIVLKKIPCDYQDQMRILKRSLKALALDGYPLAKLPNVHKLPIFKLWMDMRCGRYWTLEEKEEYLNFSKLHLHKIGICRTKVGEPVHRITPRQGRQYTWCDAKFVKAYANSVNEEFYRRAKQALISDGQGFFPTTCSYEFPTKTFRDCYFAYVPAKEEEVFAYKPWNSFDVRSLCHIRHLLRGRQTC